MARDRDDPRAEMESLIDRLHASQAMVAMAITGGGVGALATLLRRPGASRTVVEAQVPYAAPALADYLGAQPESLCSQATAEALAQRAFRRGVELRPGASTPLVGLGATAALVTDRPRRGAHRAHVASFDGFRLAGAILTLAKTARDRAAEEDLVADFIVQELAAAFGLIESPFLPVMDHDRSEHVERLVADPVDVLAGGSQPWLVAFPDGRLRPGAEAPAGLVPGSFNPWHQGHRALLSAVRRRADGRVAYELSVTNVDKSPLPAPELRRRVAQFANAAVLVLTRAPTFIEKARLLPGALFAIGADTAARVVAPDYYGGVVAMHAALTELRDLGNRFLVAGRDDGTRFVTLADVTIPPEFGDLFEPIPTEELRVDVSSSELRQRPD